MFCNFSTSTLHWGCFWLFSDSFQKYIFWNTCQQLLLSIFFPFCVPVGIFFLLKVNNGNTRAVCEICSEFTVKTRGDVNLPGVFIDYFEYKVSPFWLWANKCRVEWYSRHENLSFSVIISTFVMTLYHLTIWSHISPPWVFFTFLKYATDTKSRNASHIFKRNI